MKPIRIANFSLGFALPQMLLGALLGERWRIGLFGVVFVGAAIFVALHYRRDRP